MNKSTTRILIAVLLLVFVVVLWSGRNTQEYFTDASEAAIVKSPIGDVDLSQIPDPATAIKRVRELLDKYDKAEIWDHAAKVMDKDPGQLAREALGIRN